MSPKRMNRKLSILVALGVLLVAVQPAAAQPEIPEVPEEEVDCPEIRDAVWEALTNDSYTIEEDFQPCYERQVAQELEPAFDRLRTLQRVADDIERAIEQLPV